MQVYPVYIRKYTSLVIFVKQIRQLRSSKSNGFAKSTERRAEEIASFAPYHVLCLHGYSYFAILQTLGHENCQPAAVWNLIWHSLTSQTKWNVNCILYFILSFVYFHWNAQPEWLKTFHYIVLLYFSPAYCKRQPGDLEYFVCRHKVAIQTTQSL